MAGTWVDWLFLAGTGFVAFHGLTYRDKNGDRPWVHLLFGSIALIFFFRVLLHDVLRIW
ncbi:MAG: hypothetical protein MPJ78_08385 [Hyphomicrobiaceae bacterium]|nr:hypothetical protein [Hyphomicrobiaceae bacterium]